MVLADLGADVIRLDRPDQGPGPGGEGTSPLLMFRGQRSVGLDLKATGATGVVLRLADQADVLIEGFRPGVTERMGFGPSVCHSRNPRLIYGRMTGWGQEGDWKDVAGHDVNYIAVSGALGLIAGRDGAKPVPPLNLLGDYGGGGLLLALGVVAALFERSTSGIGQIVDAAVVDGSALLATMFFGMLAAGEWGEAGTNLIDGGAPYYDVYETADGRLVSIGAIEERFYDRLVAALGLRAEDLPDRADKAQWPRLREVLAERFKEHTRADWDEMLGGLDACYAPILSPTEAAAHPHNASRGTLCVVDGVLQPAPAPRFSRTPGAVRRRPPRPGADTVDGLLAWGFDRSEVDQLLLDRVVGDWSTQARPPASHGT
jgi:alpha-methylacyl-CoA racemase